MKKVDNSPNLSYLKRGTREGQEGFDFPLKVRGTKGGYEGVDNSPNLSYLKRGMEV